jgi:hypothetical protein
MADRQRPEVRHEEQDVNAFAITKFGIGLSIVIIVTMFVLWGLLTFFKARLTSEVTLLPGTNAVPTVSKLPPAPRLQANPRTDLRSMRTEEEQQLRGYGWIDQQHGVVRIPIERAMDILAQRGLPARPPNEGSR